MEFDESIYNLIPKEQHIPIKQKRYKSQYPMTAASSTFNLHTTPVPGSSNVNGDLSAASERHSQTAHPESDGRK